MSLRSFALPALAWLLSCAAVPVLAEPAPRVVRTLGDPSEVTCVARQGDRLWAGTLGAGVFRLQGAAPARFDATQGLPGNRVHACVVYGDALWAATEGGLARFDPAAQRFVTLLRGRYLRLAASEVVLLAARADGLVQRFEHGVAAGEIRIAAVPAALALADDGSWGLGAVDGALYAVAAAGVRRIAVPELPDQVREPIEALRFEGRTLIATTASRSLRVWPGAALARPEPRSSAAVPGLAGLERARGLLIHDRVALADGGEAIATDQGLFVRKSGAGAPSPVALDGQPCGDRISALAVQGATLWIGSFDRGLCRLDARGFTQFRGPRYLPSDMVNALAVSDSQLLVATASGLTLVEADGSFHSFTERECVGQLAARCPWHAAVNGVAVDAHDGSAWVLDVAALHRIDPHSGDWEHRGQGGGLHSSNLTRVAAFGGEVAIASSDRGFFSLRAGKLRAFDDQSGLADNWITDLAFDAAGQLWLATCTHGVSVRDTRGRFRSLTERDGLADDYVLSVQELAGRIFIGTLRGLSVLSGSHIHNLGVAEGLSGNEVHDAVLYAGEVWVATDGGLSVIALPDAN